MSIAANARTPGTPGGEVPSPEAAWDVLEHFGRALPCTSEEQQVRLTLEAVREALGADVAFWHPGSGPEPFERFGSLLLPAAWCRTFTEHATALADEESGAVVRSFLDPAAKPAAPWPCSGALVPVSRSTGSWLAALSFHPRRLFAAVDGKVMLLARRMLLNHRQQAQLLAQWQQRALVPTSFP